MNIRMVLAAALTLVSGAAMAQSAPRVTPQGVIVNPVDTSLKVSVALDKGGSNPLYVEGEKQRISVTVNQDAYVYIFDIQPNGQIAVLLPNGFSGGTPLLRAGETRTFPPAGAGYELTIAAPFGQEKILALASKRQLDLGTVIPQVRSGAFVNATVQGQDGLARALSVVVTPLPPQDWVTDSADFQTRARTVTPANGTLEVNVSPNNANVYVDGVLVGRGDTRINIPAGQHTVRATADGYQDAQQTVNIVGGQTSRLNISLQPVQRNGTLQVNVSPNNASVYVDGVLVGRGDLRINLPVGQHTVRVTADGYQDSQQTVTVSAGQPTRVTVNLQPVQRNGTLLVNVNPSNANVYIDGVLVGRGDGRINLPAGQHNLRVTADGYQESQQTVNIPAGNTISVSVNLQPIQQNGTLIVNVSPNGANVYVDGVLVGRGDTRINIPAGQHTVRVTADGFDDFQQAVNVPNGGQVSVNAALQPVVRQGTLVVRSNIVGARVFINGNEVGAIGQDGSLTINGLPTGSHELVVLAPNYRAFVSAFSINAGQATTISAILNRI